MDQESLKERTKEIRDQKALEREKALRTVTMEDNVLGLAGSMLASNRLALKAISGGIEAIESHINQIKDLKKRERDNFTRSMYVFDDVIADYSSEQWDEDQKKHQTNLDALKGLEEAMKEQADSKADSNEKEENDDGSDNSVDTPVPSDVSGGDSSREELEPDNQSGE